MSVLDCIENPLKRRVTVDRQNRNCVSAVQNENQETLIGCSVIFSGVISKIMQHNSLFFDWGRTQQTQHRFIVDKDEGFLKFRDLR